MYDSLTGLISIPLNGTEKTWKMDINGHGKCTRKGPGKSRKTTFIILYAPWFYHQQLMAVSVSTLFKT